MDLRAQVDVSQPLYWHLVYRTMSRLISGSLADLKILGPDGAGNPSPPEADPVKYTRASLLASGTCAWLIGSVVPYEQIVAAQSAAPAGTSPSSPPPTFAAATTADGLMDRRNVVTDTSQGSSHRPNQPSPCGVQGRADAYRHLGRGG